MESWVVGYEGDEDVERHASAGESAPTSSPLPRKGEPVLSEVEGAPGVRVLRLRVISDYI